MFQRIIILFFLVLSSLCIYSQNISAKVVDENNEPLVSATVYFDRTTIGVITNIDGIFNIEKPDDLVSPVLVIHYMGYESVYINDFENLADTYQLMPKPVNLDAVNIYKSPYSREDMLEVFKTYFLGERKAAKQCKILNIDDIFVYYDVDNNTLYAEADNPIQIKNKYLGYNLSFNLRQFEVQFKTKSIKVDDVKETFYAGTSFFKDINPRKAQTRNIVYDASLNYFFKALAEGNIFDTNFYVGYNGDIINPKKALAITPLQNNIYQVTLKPTVYDAVGGEFSPTQIIVTHRNDMSKILFQKPYIRVDGYGNNLDINNIRLTGELSKHRIARMLPTNFAPSGP